MFRLWFLLLAPDFPAAFLSMSQQSWPSWSSAGSSYGARSQHATAGIDRYTTLSLISPANGDSHRHLPTPTDDEGSVGDDDLDDLPSAGPENTDYVPDGASVEAKSATKKQRKRRSGKACDHCRKCRTKCMRTNVQEPCRRCLKLDIRKLFTDLRTFILLSWVDSRVCRIFLPRLASLSCTRLNFDLLSDGASHIFACTCAEVQSSPSPRALHSYSLVSVSTTFYVGSSLPFLLTECTTLMPTRQRGPQKGYLDVMEVHLHQVEALLGIMVLSKDSRARSMLEDLAKVRTSNPILDPVRKECAPDR